jgi:hypothetical protein
LMRIERCLFRGRFEVRGSRFEVGCATGAFVRPRAQLRTLNLEL